MLSPDVFTFDEAQALEDLATEVELREYASDRIVLDLTVGLSMDGEPITRPYQPHDAIRYAEAVMRREEEWS